MAPFFAMGLLPAGMLVHIGEGAPILEIWKNGEAGAVLFYPGTMLAPGHYAVLIRELLRAGFAVVGIHLSGHGECVSETGFSYYSLLGEGLKAEAWLHANGFGPVAVCGHSQGGILALAHAGYSHTLAAAFAISCVFPDMDEAISLTRFAPLAKQRAKIQAIMRRIAAIFPALPLPLPFYLQIRRILAGKKEPLGMGKAKGRISYPARFLASLFEAAPSPLVHCPFALFNAVNDALFTKELTERVYERIKAREKGLVWLSDGGHMAPLNPGLAAFIARHMAQFCAGNEFPLRLEAERREN